MLEATPIEVGRLSSPCGSKVRPIDMITQSMAYRGVAATAAAPRYNKIRLLPEPAATASSWMLVQYIHGQDKRTKDRSRPYTPTKPYCSLRLATLRDLLGSRGCHPDLNKNRGRFARADNTSRPVRCPTLAKHASRHKSRGRKWKPSDGAVKCAGCICANWQPSNRLQNAGVHVESVTTLFITALAHCVAVAGQTGK